jgi:hypothetical protein
MAQSTFEHPLLRVLTITRAELRELLRLAAANPKGISCDRRGRPFTCHTRGYNRSDIRVSLECTELLGLLAEVSMDVAAAEGKDGGRFFIEGMTVRRADDVAPFIRFRLAEERGTD